MSSNIVTCFLLIASTHANSLYGMMPNTGDQDGNIYRGFDNCGQKYGWTDITTAETCLLAIKSLFPTGLVATNNVMSTSDPDGSSPSNGEGCNTDAEGSNPGSTAYFATPGQGNGGCWGDGNCVCLTGTACSNNCQNGGAVTGTTQEDNCACSCPTGYSGATCQVTPPCLSNCACVGSWSTCDENCKKTYTVSSPKTGNGISCNVDDGTVECCSDGDCLDTPASRGPLTNLVSIPEPSIDPLGSQGGVPFDSTGNLIISFDGKNVYSSAGTTYISGGLNIHSETRTASTSAGIMHWDRDLTTGALSNKVDVYCSDLDYVGKKRKKTRKKTRVLY